MLPESDPDAKLDEGGGCSEEQLVGEMRSAKLKAVSSGCEGRGKKSLNWQSMSRLSKLNSTMLDMSKGSSLEDEREDVEEELEEWECERPGTPNGTPISMGWLEAGEECIESGREETRLTGDG